MTVQLTLTPVPKRIGAGQICTAPSNAVASVISSTKPVVPVAGTVVAFQIDIPELALMLMSFNPSTWVPAPSKLLQVP